MAEFQTPACENEIVVNTWNHPIPYEPGGIRGMEEAPPITGFALDDSHVYYSTYLTLVALDRASGEEVWRSEIPDAIGERWVDIAPQPGGSLKLAGLVGGSILVDSATGETTEALDDGEEELFPPIGQEPPGYTTTDNTVAYMGSEIFRSEEPLEAFEIGRLEPLTFISTLNTGEIVVVDDAGQVILRCPQVRGALDGTYPPLVDGGQAMIYANQIIRAFELAR